MRIFTTSCLLAVTLSVPTLGAPSEDLCDNPPEYNPPARVWLGDATGARHHIDAKGAQGSHSAKLELDLGPGTIELEGIAETTIDGDIEWAVFPIGGNCFILYINYTACKTVLQNDWELFIWCEGGLTMDIWEINERDF